MLTRIFKENQALIADRIESNDLTQIPKTYSDGMFDGKIGLKASHPENWDYWAGYCQGYREYLCNQKGITLPDEF